MCTPNKRAARSTRFNDDQLKDVKNWLIKSDQFNGRCIVCNQNILIQWNDEYVLQKHSNTDKHKKNVNIPTKNSMINSFFAKQSSKEEDLISACEVSLVYHQIQEFA